MADCVGGGVQWMQTATRYPVLDCLPPQASPLQLAPRNHPVLHPRQLPNPNVQSRLPSLLSPRPLKYVSTTLFCGLGEHALD
jgi:hypothetical protein